MKRRDFVRGLLALGVTAAVADRLAFVQGLGRVFPSAGHFTFDSADYITYGDVLDATFQGPVYIYNRVLTDDEIARNQKWFVDQYGTRAHVVVRRKGVSHGFRGQDD